MQNPADSTPMRPSSSSQEGHHVRAFAEGLMYALTWPRRMFWTVRERVAPGHSLDSLGWPYRPSLHPGNQRARSGPSSQSCTSEPMVQKVTPTVAIPCATLQSSSHRLHTLTAPRGTQHRCPIVQPSTCGLVGIARARSKPGSPESLLRPQLGASVVERLRNQM